MSDDYDTIEEQLKEKTSQKEKTHKISGRSVFRLQEIIKSKAGDATDENQNLAEEKRTK
jgi:hypothetical protein